MKKTIAMTLSVLIGSTALMFAEPPADAPAKQKQHNDGHCCRKPTKSELLKEFDKNGDGKLDKEERKALMKKRAEERMKKYDTNGDGKLSDEEKTKMLEERKQQREQRLLKKYDADHDGKLSDAERTKIREDRRKFTRDRANKPAPEKKP